MGWRGQNELDREEDARQRAAVSPYERHRHMVKVLAIIVAFVVALVLGVKLR